VEYLERILSAKKDIIDKKKKKVSLQQLENMIKSISPAREFKKAISQKEKFNIIGEIKQASPSAGIIKQDYNIVSLASEMTYAGVSAISVLTEESYFRGDLFHLIDVSETVDVPVLRKDFIIDEYQIYESRAYSADAVLLISEILADSQLKNFVQLSKEIGLNILVELHSQQNLEKVINSGAEIIGINNRNLTDFSVDINTTLKLIPFIPDEKIVVSESGIKTKEDIQKLKKVGVNCVLIGETLMKSSNIKKTIDELLS